MTLNHVHLAALDVGALQRFYETWFGFRKVADHGEGMFLRDGAGFLIAIDPVEREPRFPSWFHVGFCVDSAISVRDLHRRMRAAGVRITRKLIDLEGEATAFHCADPGGTRIEVSWHAAEA